MMGVRDVALIASTRVTAIEIARARRINCILSVAFKEFEGAMIHHWGCLPASHHLKVMLRKNILESIREKNYLVALMINRSYIFFHESVNPKQGDY